MSAANFTVVYTNANYADAGQEVEVRVTVPVDFGAEVTPETLEDYLEQLVLFAEQMWDEVDWTLDEPGWDVVSVTLPGGDVVNLADL